MKHKLSITMDEGLIVQIFEKLRDKRFRSKSHFIEYAVERFLNHEKLLDHDNHNQKGGGSHD